MYNIILIFKCLYINKQKMIRFIKNTAFLSVLLQLIKLINLNNKYLYQITNKYLLFMYLSMFHICIYLMISFVNTTYFAIYQNII